MGRSKNKLSEMLNILFFSCKGPRYVVDEIEGGDFDGTRPSELLPNQIERVQGQLGQGGRNHS